MDPCAVWWIIFWNNRGGSARPGYLRTPHIMIVIMVSCIFAYLADPHTLKFASFWHIRHFQCISSLIMTQHLKSKKSIQRNRGTILVVLHWPRRADDWERSGPQFLPVLGWMKTKSWKMSGGGRGQQVGTVRLTVIAFAGYSHLSRKTILLFTLVQILMVVCCWLCSTAELALDGDNSCTIHVWFTHVAWTSFS